MSTPHLPNKPASFWERQFAAQTTNRQRVFDVIFGIIAPILCLVFDPGIFRDGLVSESGMLGSITWFAYLAIPIQIITLVCWLWWGEDFADWTGCIAGILMAGALCAALVGVFLLPLSLMGLFLLVGVFGFIPFVTAGVFARNALRALRVASEYRSSSWFLGTLVSGVAIAIVVPATPQFYLHYQWPEIETVDIYPNADNINVGVYEVVDSGFAEEKIITFDTKDSEQQIEQFYHQVLTNSGWSQHSSTKYGYESASGRSYSLMIQYEPHANSPNHVIIRIKRPR